MLTASRRLKEFQRRLGKLGLRKNLRKGDWNIIDHHLRRRRGTRTGVYIDEVLVPWPKVAKEIGRAPKGPPRGAGTARP